MNKILYLCHRIPYPPNKGDKIRSFNEIKYLSKKYTIDLITLADDPRDLKYTKALKKICRQVQVFPLKTKIAKIKGFLSLLSGQSVSQGYFYNKSFQNIFDQWTTTENYEAVICFSSSMAEYIFKSKTRPTQNLIMDFCDLDSDKWLQYSQNKKFPANLLFKAEAARLLTFEKKINKFFTESIFISKKESDLFYEYYPRAKNIQVVPNGVDSTFFNPDQTEMNQKFFSPMIMFSGVMDYYGNVDGVIWFVEKIWPIVKKNVPDTIFYIVGSNPTYEVKELGNDPSIIVTGFVDDIREYYKAADLCVIPLRIARGVQNKVLEAMAMKKSIVSTSQATQGFISDVKNVLEIENDSREFARKIVNLMNDKNKAAKLGEDARNFVIRHYDWEKNLSGFFGT